MSSVFIVFSETGRYDDHERFIATICSTLHLAESYIAKAKEKNTYLRGLTEKYNSALALWQSANNDKYLQPDEPQISDLIRSTRGELCSDCKPLRLSQKEADHRPKTPLNELCQQCLSKEDRKKAVDIHSMNKSKWHQACQEISEKYHSDQKAWTQGFLGVDREKLKEFGIIDISNWHPHAYYDEDYEIEEHEVVSE
jgi:mannose-6-phosphate isomerase class I